MKCPDPDPVGYRVGIMPLGRVLLHTFHEPFIQS